MNEDVTSRDVGRGGKGGSCLLAISKSREGGKKRLAHFQKIFSKINQNKVQIFLKWSMKDQQDKNLFEFLQFYRM